MCGIYAAVSASTQGAIAAALEQSLRSRGPDYVGTVETRLEGGSDLLSLYFTSTVLSLRGEHVAEQPLIDNTSGSILCWNGEVWKMRGQSIGNGNDGQVLLTELGAARRYSTGQADTVVDVLRTIEGPFAFVYFDKPNRRLYYGRDRLGRRSLLLNQGDLLTLASVAGLPKTGWVEVDADGCYSIELDPSGFSAHTTPTRHAWAQDKEFISSLGVFNTATRAANAPLTRQSPSVVQLRDMLIKSLRLRVLGVPLPPGASSKDARIAVLFSGGVDCTVLARLTSDVLPAEHAIDLINVAFENPRIAADKRKLSGADVFEMCPDRLTGRRSFSELVETCPARRWRLVTVNVPFSLTSCHRSKIIDLMYPHNTEMDLSIAYALYFAARGSGLCQSSPCEEARPYTTTARVLVSGFGADELFGGYTRHATAFNRQGYAGLVEELMLDMRRLGKRNLGRDDRVMAHWGREVRFPFLDEDLAKWAIGLPVFEKCDFGNGSDIVQGLEASKRVVRLLAQDLGLQSAAAEKKRAIQFGARTAKMESARVKGTALIAP
ncbi:hypothetical protein CDD81_2277 [Ophiocordyceps australis]|uniref:Glutamine amidotransferase type-2 domain-containing protein n=1 Tax=Ophiocordyceps australis TaxID=1399860 RepID=A0A2C5Y9W2_9HYPO|nr:hypothetical protein CDD81_2277 [Ophiocordyceps australis]